MTNMYKKGTVVLIKDDIMLNRIKHHVGAKIAIVEEAYKLKGFMHNNYRLKVLYPGGGTGIVAWFSEASLIYICESIDKLTDLERLIYDLT